MGIILREKSYCDPDRGRRAEAVARFGERIRGQHYCEQLNGQGTGDNRRGGGAMNMQLCQKDNRRSFPVNECTFRMALLPKTALKEFGLGS